jgi:CheY-like chemotaxis protein
MRTRVLIVDDEPQALEALRDLLHKDSFEVVTASSAREALTVLVSHPVDVVLSDECMPGMTGLQFLAAVAQDYPETVRMIITGKAKLETMVQALNDGVLHRFLTKPCPAKTLLAAITEGLARRVPAAPDPRLRLRQYAEEPERGRPSPRSAPRAAAGRPRPVRDAEFSFRGFVDLSAVYAMLVEVYRRQRAGVSAFGVDCQDVEDFSPFAIVELLRAVREFKAEGVSIKLLGTPEGVVDRLHESAVEVLVA